MRNESNRKGFMLLPVAIAVLSNAPVAAAGKNADEDSVFAWGRWRSLAPAAGVLPAARMPEEVESSPVVRPEDAEEYDRTVQSLAQSAPVAAPEEKGPEAPGAPSTPADPGSWQGCSPGSTCVYATYDAYEWTEIGRDPETGQSDSRSENLFGPEPAWLESFEYQVEIDGDKAWGSTVVQPWKEDAPYLRLELDDMTENGYEREADPPLPAYEIELSHYEFSTDTSGLNESSSEWEVDFRTQPVSGRADVPPFIRGHWTWNSEKVSHETAGGAGSTWRLERGGRLVGGMTTTLETLEAMGAGGVIARYGGGTIPIAIEVNFAEASWAGSWYNGMDAYDPDFGLRFASVIEDSRGVRYLDGIDMGFEAKGHIEGVNFVSDEITAKDAASISGIVRGSFFGPNAEAVGGISDVTKTVTEESAAAARDGRSFTYENARQVSTFFIGRSVE